MPQSFELLYSVEQVLHFLLAFALQDGIKREVVLGVVDNLHMLHMLVTVRVRCRWFKMKWLQWIRLALQVCTKHIQQLLFRPLELFEVQLVLTFNVAALSCKFTPQLHGVVAKKQGISQHLVFQRKPIVCKSVHLSSRFYLFSTFSWVLWPLWLLLWRFLTWLKKLKHTSHAVIFFSLLRDF